MPLKAGLVKITGPKNTIDLKYTYIYIYIWVILFMFFIRNYSLGNNYADALSEGLKNSP